ncbi:flagellar biosynthetic protein FliR [Alphaproteobacteria bacterium]|jgi:flagellar biosynthesis protein FliR|nr:flagellar biosynthetic protein FliR [Alphaproteobacteria bacterium]
MIPVIAQSMTGLPGVELQSLIDLLLQFFVTMLRIGAFLISSPLLGARWVPLQVRITMGVMLTLVIWQITPPISIALITSSQAFLIIFSELVIGLSAGLILTIWFSAVLLAGEKVAGSSGLSFAAQMDPSTGGQTPVVSQIFYLFMLVLFTATDGHLIAIATLLDSYRILPIGVIPSLDIFITAGIQAAGSMFFAAAIIMLPFSIILLLINVSIGIITRSAPSLNLFSIGFPITLIAIFIVFYFSATSLANSLSDLADASLLNLQDIMEALIDG